MEEETKTVEKDWIIGNPEGTNKLLDFKAKKEEERKDKELDHRIDSQSKDNEFRRDLIKEGFGFVATIVLILIAVLLSRADSKDEAAMVAGIAGTFGGSFTALTKTSISKKNESDN